MSDLQKKPFHRALHRSNLIMGGQRGPMIFCLMITGILIMAMNLPSVIVGVIFGVSSVTILRALAKADPYMISVIHRHLMHKDYYPPYSRPYRKANSSRNY